MKSFVNKFSLSLFLFSFFIWQSAEASDLSLVTKSLKLGMSDSEIISLQTILNSDSDTIVALSGPGSSGQETRYFGAKTYNAVIRFQEKYKREVLAPAGLYSGTGFVGPLTIAKLTYISQGISQTNPQTSVVVNGVVQSGKNISVLKNQSSISLPESFVQTDDFYLSGISANMAIRGQKISVFGTHLSPVGNVVYLGDKYALVDIKSNSSKTALEFSVPEDMPFGRYDVVVGNINGKSKNNMVFVVRDPKVSYPKIVSASPSETSDFGSVITLKGSGFASQNEIRSSFGVLSGLSSSDNETISFVLKNLPEASKIAGQKNSKTGQDFALYFYVVNDFGVSLPSSLIIHL